MSSQSYSTLKVGIEDVKAELERLLSRQVSLEYLPQDTINYLSFRPFSSPILLSIPLKLIVERVFRGVKIEASPSINVFSDFLDDPQGGSELHISLFSALEEARKAFTSTGIGSRDIALIRISYYEDPEVEGLEKLFISFRIRSKDFSELQRLWDRVIDAFYSVLPQYMVDKIVVEVEPGD